MPYIKFYKMRNEKEITDKIKERIEIYKIEISIFEKVIPIINEFKDKKITKRIATKIQNELKDYNVYYDTQYGMFNINIYLTKNNNNKVRYLLGHKPFDNTEAILKQDKINDLIRQNEVTKEYIEKYEKGLNEIKNLCNEFNEAINTLKEINEKAEKYNLEYEFDINDK